MKLLYPLSLCVCALILAFSGQMLWIAATRWEPARVEWSTAYAKRDADGMEKAARKEMEALRSEWFLPSKKD